MEMVVHTARSFHPNLGYTDSIDGYVSYFDTLGEAKLYVDTSINIMLHEVLDDEEFADVKLNAEFTIENTEKHDRWAMLRDGENGTEDWWSIVHMGNK